jgi:LysM repeat protein
MYGKIILGLVILILLMILFIVIHKGSASSYVNASSSDGIYKLQETQREKVITSIKIQKGDSLWTIAKQYYSDEYKDLPAFIHEIKKTNGLTGDSIHYGNYLVVPHYQ